VELYLGDVKRAWIAVWTGAWCSPAFEFALGEPRVTEDGLKLKLSSPRSTYTATLVLDPETCAPRRLV
jgi:hypothetical protein